MKYFKFLILIPFVLLFVLYTFGVGNNNGFDESVENAFKEGNAKKLSTFFFENVELKLLDNENVYSKVQAQAVLNQFFDQYRPSEFQIQDYTTKNSSNSAIAKLKTKNGNFRVILKIKGIKTNFYLQSLQIEKDDDKQSKG